jgi:hypothetical protein
MQKTMSIPRSYDRNDLITSSTVKEGIAGNLNQIFALTILMMTQFFS